MAKTNAKKKEDEAPPVDGEAAAAEGEEGAPKKKGLPIMLIAIIAVVVLILGGGGAGAYFMFLAPKHPPAKVEPKKAEKKKDAKKDDKADKPDPKTQPVITDGPNGITYYQLPDTIANIQSPDGHASYLKLTLTFECPDQDTVDALNANMPRINDVLQGFIRELRPEDLTGSEANYMMRLEILRRVNLVLAPQKVNAVDIINLLIT